MKWCTDGMSIDPLPRKAEEGSVLGSLPVRLDNSENSNAPKNDRVDDNEDTCMDQQGVEIDTMFLVFFFCFISTSLYNFLIPIEHS